MSVQDLPLADVSDDQLLALTLDRPPSSVYDVVAVYGRINSMLVTERVPGDVPAEHVTHMTPDNDKIQGLYDQEDSLLNVHVDLSGEEPKLADELVTLERLTWEKAVRVGYTRPIKKRGKIIAHSIPHHANGKKAGKTAKYSTDRLTRWPTDDEVSRTAEESDDETVIDQLRALGGDDAAVERVRETVEERVETIGGSFEGLVSLKIKTEPKGLFRYPGEIPIVNEAMVAKKTERMKGYSEANDSSGEAADYVTGKVGTALGATPGSPVEYFHGKQMEKFPNFDPDEGYQVRPLSEETAANVAAGQAYTASCSVDLYVTGENGFQDVGIEMRYLPYLSSTDDADDVRRLAGLLDTALNGDQRFRELLADRLNERSRFADRLKLYQIVVATDLDEKDKILTERGEIDGLSPVTIGDRHVEVLGQWPHASDDWRGVFRSGGGQDRFSLLDPENVRLPESVLSGQYFDETLYNPQRNSNDPIFGPDDVQVQCLVALMSEKSIPASRYRESLVRRIVEKQNDLLGDDSRNRDFPFYLLAKQHAQWSTLVACDTLDGEALPAIDPDTQMPDETTSRDGLLEQFIENHPLLKEPERQTCFLLGALVGRLSAYQMREGYNTMIRRYPVENVTKRNVPRIVHKVIGKNNDYSDMEDNTGVMNLRYQTRLTDLLHRTEPSEWSLSTDEVRMHYALGISYGYSDTSPDADEEESEEEPAPKANQPAATE
ncbi:TM1802 family CRISPR-associated protein [Halobaculum sp. MBLA0143]|uniref:TM1802 family CRISPR-associated protein n=1 Tax=Halobaculum sp. MBLA0143 TaxID=3079933 RepID=UPI00352567EC